MNRICLALIFILAFTSPLFAALPDKVKSPGGASTATVLALPASEVVYIVLSFRTGAADDPEGLEGLNFITTRVIEDQIDRALDDRAPTSGAPFSATTDKEITTYFLKVHREKLKEVYPVFIKGVTAPRMDEDLLQRAITQAANSREYLSSQGESLAKAALERFIYRGHPYGKPDSGTEKSLARIKTGDVDSFFKSHYTRDNYDLGVAGKEPGAIKEMVTKDLAALPAGKPEKPALISPERVDRNRVLIVRKDGGSCDVAMGFPEDFTRADDDFYPLMIVNSYFGQHRYLSCLLCRGLRKMRGFNYGDYSYIEKFRESGQDKMPGVRFPRSQQYFSIWLRTLSNENAWFAARYALYQLNQMAEKGLSDKDFGDARDFVKYNSMLWAYDPMQQLGFSMDSAFYGTPYFINLIGGKMKTVTNGDVTSALSRRLAHRKMKMVFVTGDPETLKARLLGQKESRPVYRSPLPAQEREVDEQVLKYDCGLTEKDIEIIDAGDL